METGILHLGHSFESALEQALGTRVSVLACPFAKHAAAQYPSHTIRVPASGFTTAVGLSVRGSPA